jgi:NAD(P)-dependent dehydrogenase (short-subunit alcohol dehydrogenase family)
MTHTDYWNGKSAVVTGGARGQGRSIAIQLLKAGAGVHVIDSLEANHPEWIQLNQLANSTPGQLSCHVMDVADEQAWIEFGKALKNSGKKIHGLVNNAGITGARNTVTQTDLQMWQRVFDVNLKGPLLGIKILAPDMPAGASIVSISSIAGLTGYYSAAYSSSKWALRGLTKSAALELAGKGIRVNCICPGVVDTEMIRNSEKLFQALQHITPVGQMASADQIADAMFFLLGPQSGYITGADLPVDGGISGAGIFWPVGKAVGAV